MLKIIAFQSFYDAMGISVAAFEYDRRMPGDKIADILYAKPHDLCFTYLIAKLRGKEAFGGERFRRVLIDEADHPLLDERGHACRIVTKKKEREIICHTTILPKKTFKNDNIFTFATIHMILFDFV